ncbi:MAG: hypothetical protein FWD47_14950 [Treponema sp.]|nr:hypothetical protein [Treponema sp.]
MRKILVVLLVLSVLGGAFAQGSWSVSGNADIATVLNFENDDAFIGGSAYFMYDWYGDINGALRVGYNDGGLSAFIQFDTADLLGVGFTYTGDRFGFTAETALIQLLGGYALTDGSTDVVGIYRGGTIGRLWGYYRMLDMIHMEIAYVSGDKNFWNSDETAGEIFDFGWGYASVDGENYFLLDLEFSGLNIGFMLPGIFAGPQARGDDGRKGIGNVIDYYGAGAPGYHPSMNGGMNFEFTEVMRWLVAGMKFEMHPIEFAAQFSMENYGAYLGAKWFAGPLTFGLNFQGEFDAVTVAAIGASVAYDAGQFGAKIGAGYWFEDNAAVDNVIGVMPSFYYNVLPDNMCVSLDALFLFGGDDFYWEFTPQIWWNFKGTGAGNNYYWPMDTGMIIRYYVAKETFNAVDVTFRWSF